MDAIKYRADLYKIIDLSLPAVELGVAEGQFSRDILNWGVVKLYSIDAWTTINGQKGDGGFDQEWHNMNYEKAKLLLKPFGERSVILRGLSVEMSRQLEDDSLGFVNVDCDHSYEGVKADIQAYWPKLKVGGVMAFHDYEIVNMYGVKKAVEEFAKLNGLEVNLLPENKIEDAGAWIRKK